MQVVIALARDGHLSREETVVLANALLEGGRAGSAGLSRAARSIANIVSTLHSNGNTREAVQKLQDIAMHIGSPTLPAAITHPRPPTVSAEQELSTSHLIEILYSLGEMQCASVLCRNK